MRRVGRAEGGLSGLDSIAIISQATIAITPLDDIAAEPVAKINVLTPTSAVPPPPPAQNHLPDTDGAQRGDYTVARRRPGH